jgi:serine/threonine protein kinase
MSKIRELSMTFSQLYIPLCLLLVSIPFSACKNQNQPENPIPKEIPNQEPPSISKPDEEHLSEMDAPTPFSPDLLEPPHIVSNDSNASHLPTESLLSTNPHKKTKTSVAHSTATSTNPSTNPSTLVHSSQTLPKSDLPEPKISPPMTQEKASQIITKTLRESLRPLHRVSEDLQEEMKTKDLLYTNRANQITLQKIQEGFIETEKKEIGKGMYGAAYLIYINRDHPHIACKIESKTCRPYVLKKMTAFTPKAFADEIAIFHYLGPNKRLVHYYGSFKKENAWYIALEKADGDLTKLLAFALKIKSNPLLIKLNEKNDPNPDDQEGPLTDLREKLYRTIAQHLIEGITFLHSKGIAHRDIKPDNILFYIDKKTGEYSFKIADFGGSFSVKQKEAVNVTTPIYIGTYEKTCFGKSYLLFPYRSLYKKGDYTHIAPPVSTILPNILHEDQKNGNYCRRETAKNLALTEDAIKNTFPLRFIVELDPKSSDVFALSQTLLMAFYRILGNEFTPNETGRKFYRENSFLDLHGEGGVLTQLQHHVTLKHYSQEKFNKFSAFYEKTATQNPFKRAKITDIHPDDL